MDTHICIYIYSLHSLLLIYVCLHDGTSSIGWPLGVLFLGKIISPTQHFLFLCTSLYRLSPHDLFPIHVSMSTIIVLRSSCLGLHIAEILWVQHLTLIRDGLRANSLILLLLQPFCHLLQCFLILGCRGCFVNVFIETFLHSFAFWLVVVFCNHAHLLQTEIFSMRMRATFICV